MVAKGVNSEVRLGILDELLHHGELNLAYFAKRFGISNGAITAHIKKLHEAGLIEITTPSGIRGTQKICTLATEKIVVDFVSRPEEEGRVESSHIDVGQYVDYDIRPTCGLATWEKVIGKFDDPACFSYPERIKAGILWFSRGFVEYLVPNYLTAESELKELRFSVELASEAPGYAAYYPSDIFFSVNGVRLGSFLSKGEFNDRTGSANPGWWYGNLGQYGKKVRVAVNREGTYISGVRVSDVTCGQLGLKAGDQIRLRISVPDDAPNCGGVTIFGRGFGDYDEGIVCQFVY